jgi:hypothetical protein
MITKPDKHFCVFRGIRDLVNLIQLTEDNIIGDHIKRLSLCVLLMHLHCLAVKFKYLLGDIKAKKQNGFDKSNPVTHFMLEAIIMRFVRK